jgi:hypothetical protein
VDILPVVEEQEHEDEDLAWDHRAIPPMRRITAIARMLPEVR